MLCTDGRRLQRSIPSPVQRSNDPQVCVAFPKDDSFHNLEAALKEQNVKEAFRAAHTLKGVCQNLGFSNLYAPAVTLTETLRAGQLEGTAEQFAEVEKQYRITMAAIQALD